MQVPGWSLHFVAEFIPPVQRRDSLGVGVVRGCGSWYQMHLGDWKLGSLGHFPEFLSYGLQV